MSHIRDCPEFQLGRSDSKNPLTTCQGVTFDGRKCRRTVISAREALKKEALEKQPRKAKQGEIDIPVEDLLCWQHKDQAPSLKPKVAAAASKTAGLRNRSSIDTIAERVGLLNLNDNKTSGQKGHSSRNNQKPHEQPERRTRHRDRSEHQQRPATPSHFHEEEPQQSRMTHKSKKRSSLTKKLICFFAGVGAGEFDEFSVRRRGRPRTASHPGAKTASNSPIRRPGTGRRPTTAESHKHRTSAAETRQPTEPRVSNIHRRSLPPGVPYNPSRPSMLSHSTSESSQTQTLLSWIPTSLSPETTSKLLQKLSEPLSLSEEWGYIYIYCVTPQKTVPIADVIPSLIPQPQEICPPTTEILRTAGVSPNRVQEDGRRNVTNTLTLKIGRAVNVSRRLTQQCHQNLTLVRYYPYSSSSVNGSPPRKAPNIHRLERLVHIELSDRRVKLQDPCPQCGKRHQEYFEIEATEEQLRIVDECVRRWARFSELDPSR